MIGSTTVAKAIGNQIGRYIERKSGANFGALVPGQSYSLMDSMFARWFSGNVSSTGKSITDESAMRITTVFSCVRVLAETIGGLPLAVYDATTGKKADDHPVAALMRYPNEFMTGQELIEAEVVNLALQGNACGKLSFGSDGQVSSIIPVPWNNAQLVMRDNGSVFYRTSINGKQTENDPKTIWHVKGFGPNGYLGLAPLSAAREAFSLALMMEEFQGKFYANGARVSGTIEIPQWLKKDEREVAQKLLEDKYTGLANAHKLMLLEGGMKFSSMAIPPQDAQFLESRRFQKEEICSIFRVPPHLVADLSRATFSNIEQQSLDFVMFTLLPYLIRFEKTANRRLFRAEEAGRYFVRFNFEGLLRADSVSRAQLYSVLLQNGVISRNEARGLENLPKSNDDGMDDFTVQTNMALLQMLEHMKNDAITAAVPGMPPAAPVQPVAQGATV